MTERVTYPQNGHIRPVDRISRRASSVQTAWIAGCLTFGSVAQLVRNLTGG